MTLRALPIAILLLMAVVAGCQQTKVGTQDVVSNIPWPDHEETHYILQKRDGTEVGRGSLMIERDGPNYKLSTNFEGTKASGTDNTTLLAEGTTLKPLSMTRVIQNKDQESRVEALYENGAVGITASNKGKGRKNAFSVPEHSYDKEESLFLWRTIPFSAGYIASYTSVVTNEGKKGTATVSVSGQETVDVPAGHFDAWLVVIRSSNLRQLAWYAVQPPHYLIRYDNGDLVFLLEKLP